VASAALDRGLQLDGAMSSPGPAAKLALKRQTGLMGGDMGLAATTVAAQAFSGEMTEIDPRPILERHMAPGCRAAPALLHKGVRTVPRTSTDAPERPRSCSWWEG
jgi:hypothetical protein